MSTRAGQMDRTDERTLGGYVTLSARRGQRYNCITHRRQSLECAACTITSINRKVGQTSGAVKTGAWMSPQRVLDYWPDDRSQRKLDNRRN